MGRRVKIRRLFRAPGTPQLCHSIVITLQSSFPADSHWLYREEPY
jgi:hypothetical protein